MPATNNTSNKIGLRPCERRTTRHSNSRNRRRSNRRHRRRHLYNNLTYALILLNARYLKCMNRRTCPRYECKTTCWPTSNNNNPRNNNNVHARKTRRDNISVLRDHLRRLLRRNEPNRYPSSERRHPILFWHYHRDRSIAPYIISI